MSDARCNDGKRINLVSKQRIGEKEKLVLLSQTASLLELDDNPHLKTSTGMSWLGITRSKVFFLLRGSFYAVLV